MADFKAAIFDLDGTLLDSMDVWERIDIEFLAKRNLSVPDDYINEICARSFIEAAEYTINLFGLNENIEDIIAEWNAMALYEYSHNVPLRKTAKDYLTRLRSSGVKLAVATSLPSVLYTPALQNNGVYDIFEVMCSTDDVKRGKEYPDIFLYTAEKLNVSPAECVVFEDVLPAVMSAKAARMRVYGMYDKYSEQYKPEILKYADGYLYDFQNAPLAFY